MQATGPSLTLLRQGVCRPRRRGVGPPDLLVGGVKGVRGLGEGGTCCPRVRQHRRRYAHARTWPERVRREDDAADDIPGTYMYGKSGWSVQLGEESIDRQAPERPRTSPSVSGLAWASRVGALLLLAQERSDPPSGGVGLHDPIIVVLIDWHERSLTCMLVKCVLQSARASGDALR